MRIESDIFIDAQRLHTMWTQGKLGGETMPEDVHPKLLQNSDELLHYLTLGMCLNYQRNAYSLWAAATKTFEDEAVNWVFDPQTVANCKIDSLRAALGKHRLALQPNKHTDNWFRVSSGIAEFGDGYMSKIFKSFNYDIEKIRCFIQDNRKDFPYLAGNKICNYWLFVLLQYTSFPLANRQELTIAPDRHVLKASVQLGLLTQQDIQKPSAQKQCADTWEHILHNSKLLPIDMHTPLWLWSQLKFPKIAA